MPCIYRCKAPKQRFSMSILRLFFFILTTVLILPTCQKEPPRDHPADQKTTLPESPAFVDFRPEDVPYKKLSEYGFFEGFLAAQQARKGVLPYELITPLFTDYAHKARFIWMPDSVQATTDAEGRLIFLENSVLIKTFYYPADFRKPDADWNLVETRLLFKKSDGWHAYTYVWDDTQSDAELNLVGDYKAVSWIDEEGKKQAITYAIPNKNQCKSCHNRNNSLQPIGPRLRNLNRTFVYSDGRAQQLDKWVETGYLKAGFTPEAGIAPWDDPQATNLEARALSYLDVNCGHCHQAEGPAHTTGLYLTADETDPGRWGICKTPVAAGKGSGGRRFGIQPGQPNQSILVYRMESKDPGVMMPELGRVTVHKEGLALIREWITSMDENCL